MIERVLGTRELNRALLARQRLLRRWSGSIPDVLERVGGIQMQYAPSGYVGLWTRLAQFHGRDLTRALEQRRVVQGTLMRVTIHLVSAADYWPMAVALRDGQREWWLRVWGRELSVADMRRAARVSRRLLGVGPMRGAHLLAALRAEGFPSRISTGIGLWVDLVRIPPSGTWDRRRADLLGLADDWLGPPPPTASVAAGCELLVRRYLTGFGPATPREIADWAGLSVAAVRSALQRMSTRTFRDEGGRQLVDLPRLPLPDAATPVPPIFLPVWDANLLVHARRTGVVPEEMRPRLFNPKAPQSMNTFLLDGKVAGAWRHDGERIRIEPFRRLSRDERREVETAAGPLADFYAAQRAERSARQPSGQTTSVRRSASATSDASSR